MKDNPDTDKERISIDDNKRRIIMIRIRKECVVYLNVASTRPCELVPRRPPALKEDNFCSFAHEGRHQQFFLDIVLNNGGVRSPKLLNFFETFSEVTFA